jgi:N-formylglutamate amidohydrolase
VTPLVIHIPHASERIPAGDRGDFLLSDEELAAETLRLTDRFTDELYADGADPEDVVAVGVSRLVVDVERFEDDAREPCAKVGMGATYVSTHDGRPLRLLTAAARERLLAAHHRPHHRRLDEAARRRLGAFGRCLVLDGHSFPSRPLPTQVDFGDPPEIGLGVEPGHTPEPLRDLAVHFFRSRGYDVAVDRPYSGSMVPSAFLGRDARVSSLMVEVRRDLYMDEDTGRRHAGFGLIRAALTEFRAALSARA